MSFHETETTHSIRKHSKLVRFYSKSYETTLIILLDLLPPLGECVGAHNQYDRDENPTEQWRTIQPLNVFVYPHMNTLGYTTKGEHRTALIYQYFHPQSYPFNTCVWMNCHAECDQDDGRTSALQTSSCFGISSGADALIMCILWYRRWTQDNVWSLTRGSASNSGLLCGPLLSGPWCGDHGNGMQRRRSVTVEKRGTVEGLFEHNSLCLSRLYSGELI